MSESKQENQSSKDMETFFPEGKAITIAGKEFRIKPFVLKNRIKVVKLFSKVFLEAAKNPSFGNLTDLGLITTIINIAEESLTDVYISVLECEDTSFFVPDIKSWLETNVQLKDEINIVKTIMEVNDIPLLLSQIQEMKRPK